MLTANIDEAIRQAEITGIRSAIEATRRLAPEVGAIGLEIAGGLAAFTGSDSPLSQAYGVAARSAISEREIATLADFFQSRAAVPRVFVTPSSHPSLATGLAKAGFAPVESENVLVCEALASRGQRSALSTEAADSGAWARASAAGFLDRQALQGEELIASILASSQGATVLEVREGGEIVATAAMDVRGECAALFAGSTLAEFRRRGFHLLLVRDRIARACERGARLLRATAKPGSASERNFLRCDFATLYTRVLWERAAS